MAKNPYSLGFGVFDGFGGLGGTGGVGGDGGMTVKDKTNIVLISIS